MTSPLSPVEQLAKLREYVERRAEETASSFTKDATAWRHLAYLEMLREMDRLAREGKS